MMTPTDKNKYTTALPAPVLIVLFLLAFQACQSTEQEDIQTITPDNIDINLEDKVMDIDGNIYKTVQIGEQIWMAENLKVSRFADGSRVQFVEDQQAWFDFTRESEGYCWYDNVPANGYVYGALYTWPAAVGGSDGSDLIPSGIQGVCPDEWHLPSDGEWKQLEMHLGISQQEADREDWRGTDQGGQLKQDGNNWWESPNSGATNESGFNALPGGYRNGSGHFKDIENSASFWTSSGRGYGFGWFRELAYDTASVKREFAGVYSGYSIRCVKNN